jgi:hypothetical protein
MHCLVKLIGTYLVLFTLYLVLHGHILLGRLALLYLVMG